MFDMTDADPGPGSDPSRRLLEAAGEVFAERGFRGATIREISRRAKANVAAVNYHFGDKARLYAAVLEHAQRSALAKYPPGLGLKPGAGPEEKLRAFIHSFLLRLLDEGQPAWHGQLMTREMADPTPALDRIVDSFIRPAAGDLGAVLRALLGPAARPDDLRRGAYGVVGLCLFYRHARPVLDRLDPGRRYDAREISTLADYILRFTLAGLRAASAGSTTQRRQDAKTQDRGHAGK